MMPSVVLAFLSFANWKRSFFWLVFVLGEVFMDVRRPVRDLRLVVLFAAALPDSIGHWDSLLLREAKQRPNADLSRLH